MDELVAELERDADAFGYHLNPDSEFTRALAEGLLVNEERYGYRCCPCRLAAGDRTRDLPVRLSGSRSLGAGELLLCALRVRGRPRGA